MDFARVLVTKEMVELRGGMMLFRKAAGAGALLGLIALAAAPGTSPLAQTQTPAESSESERSVERFAGAWVGRTTEGTTVDRRATLGIEPTEGGGFTVTWTSFEAPTRSDSGIIRRERKLDFVQTDTPGLYRARGANDPVTDLAAWAYIDGDVLSLSTVAVQPDGRLERQIYDRTLSADGLFLSYRRYLDADLVRTIDVEFVRL